MVSRTVLKTLSDPESFRRRRAAAWEKNIDYWLQSSLRHVDDVGDYISKRTSCLCKRSERELPIVVDMGCGSAWLLRSLLKHGVSASYIGLDCTRQFIEHARAEFGHLPNVRFDIVDLEKPVELFPQADIVVNSFSFFELFDLSQGFANASRFLTDGGTLLMSTIDKTYLLVALSCDWKDFMDKLRIYQELPGIKYAFQPIDLGDRASTILEYPSVLYSTEDYLRAARETGLKWRDYKEQVFTAKRIPKIYCHLEFEKHQPI